MRRLPPLNALRAFEVVARRGSLTKAAEELLVTPTAVGRHIKNIEDILRIQLFHREAGILVLTDRGRTYARDLNRAFQTIADSTDTLLDMPGRVQLSLRTYTTFLIRWLIPRLPRFYERHPDVELKLSAAYEPVDFNRDRIDIGVRYGNGKWPGLSIVRLFEDELVAFGNSTIRDRFEAESLASGQSSVPILVHSRRPDDWADWLQAAGIPPMMLAQQITFDDLALIYQGALDGLGVALSQRRYIERDLATGRLYQVSDTILRRQRGYYLICPPDVARSPAGKAFITWLTAEASR
jgi:LysR family glycine cleavage system transcriptional activator